MVPMINAFCFSVSLFCMTAFFWDLSSHDLSGCISMALLSSFNLFLGLRS